MQKFRRGGTARLTVTLSALSAIGIILGKFLAFNVTDFMRFSLENITIIFTGIVFGPLFGGIVGAVQDLVGCIAVGYAINPIITLGSALIGVTSGYIFRLGKRLPLGIRIALSVLPSHALGSVLVKTLGLSIFYSLPFGITALWRILNYAIVGSAEIALLLTLLKSKQLLSQINKIAAFTPHTTFKNISEATAYTKNASGIFSKPGLERVTELLTGVGNPESSLKVVHVAGTNGKGSFSAMLTSILAHSKIKVGSFNSPYLVEMRESIRINCEPISEDELISLLDKLRPIADSMADKPTEFELLTAAAYLAFYESGVDVAVVECGMGGEGDATNVITFPLLSVITGVSIDHTSYLGNTASEIAKVKSGIIKHGCPVLVGELGPEAMSVISDKAKRESAPLSVADSNATVHEMTLNGTLLDCCGINGIRLPLLGIHQTKNAALAIRAAILLGDSFPSISEESIRCGIAAVRWQGRFEILSRKPLFIFDGGHNLEGVKCAVESIRQYLGDGVVYLGGVLADKEYETMADEIAKVASHAVTVTPDNSRALSAPDYADVLRSRGVNADYALSVSDGVKKAIAIAKRESRAVVCLGSLYLYKEVTKAVHLAQ